MNISTRKPLIYQVHKKRTHFDYISKHSQGINDSIEDTGIGMSEEFMKIMYYKVYQ
jgi:hypothetical protein